MQAVKKTAVVKPDGNIEVPATEFAPGASVEVIVLGEPPVAAKKTRYAFLLKASELSIDGPPDWSANVDKYLYGPDNGTK